MNELQPNLLLGLPDFVTLETENEQFTTPVKADRIQKSDVSISFVFQNACQKVTISANTTPIKSLKCRWKKKISKNTLFLGDAWERGYGDLQWQHFSAKRIMPWFFMAKTDSDIQCFGVQTRPASMCYWQVDPEGITLFLDTRCGGEGVILSGRTLHAASIVTMTGTGISSFQAAKYFCHEICPDPIFPSFPVYGSNNWYYAYGDSSEEEILADTDYLLELTKGASNPPFMVIDDCWQEHHRLDEYNGGPWRAGNDKFPDMKALAKKLVAKGVRPGIWVRLLQNEDTTISDSWRLSHNGCLDPSHPEALAYIQQDIKRICEWGYTMIKHDFSTFDLFGRWGFEMNPLVTPDGWHFYDRHRTSAEIVIAFYSAIMKIAKPYRTLILGCNTIGHLGAGLMQMQRTGDDTSGKNWERTRQMGINSLAFRLPQHRTFFDIDADCVGITGDIPWSLNKQWADVIAESGTSLFISAKPGVLTDAEKEELHQIMLKASSQNIHKYPADWDITDCPDTWTDKGETLHYNWYPEEGISLESKQDKYYRNLPLS